MTKASPRSVRSKFEAKHDAAPAAKGKPHKGEAADPKAAAKALGAAATKSPKVKKDSRDSLDPEGSVAAQLLKKLRDERVEFRPSHAKKVGFGEEDFMEFFGAEIERELERNAFIVNDRYARWPCQCCDVVIPIPRRTEVFHGDYHLVHDDVMGLLVNGERWIPKAETPIEVVQPGRLRNPWTGKTLAGKDLGTTGVYDG